MGWLFACGLALASFAAVAWLSGWRRQGWELVAATLLAGIAGYAAQAHPGLPGAPKLAAALTAGDGAALVEERNALSGRAGLPGDNWLMIADGFVRNGRYADAAGMLKIAVEKQPGNGEAWLALANALVAHAEGMVTPASLNAYDRATRAAPDRPGPPYFLGLALAQSGRFGEARAIWAQLLERSPKEAPWRADLAGKLGRLDELIARQNAAGPGQ